MAQMSQPSAAILSALIEGGRGVVQTKYTYFAAIAFVIYDHLLTFDIEVKHIWRQKFSAVTVLFFLTRYYFLLVLTLTLFLFVEPVINITTCERILLFIPIGVGAILTALPNFVIALRIYALYERNKTLALALLIYILAQAGASLWFSFIPSVTRIDVFTALGYPELNNVPALRFCVPQLSTKLTGVQTSLNPIMQSIFDTITLALILIKARKSSGSGLIALITKQGLAYYLLNVATFLTWTLMLLFGPASSKAIMGGPTLGLVCVSVNRLTLQLRSYSSDSNARHIGSPRVLSLAFGAKRQRRNSWLGASTLEVPDASSDGGQNTLEMCDMFSDSELYDNHRHFNGDEAFQGWVPTQSNQGPLTMRRTSESVLAL